MRKNRSRDKECGLVRSLQPNGYCLLDMYVGTSLGVKLPWPPRMMRTYTTGMSKRTRDRQAQNERTNHVEYCVPIVMKSLAGKEVYVLSPEYLSMQYTKIGRIGRLAESILLATSSARSRQETTNSESHGRSQPLNTKFSTIYHIKKRFEHYRLIPLSNGF